MYVTHSSFDFSFLPLRETAWLQAMIFDSFPQPTLSYSHYAHSESLQLQNSEKPVLYARQITNHPITAFFVLGAFATISYLAGYYQFLNSAACSPKEEKESRRPGVFRPELPSLPLEPVTSDPDIQSAARRLDSRLQDLYKGGSIDSLSIGIVGENGLLLTRGYGFVNAKKKDTAQCRKVDENTIYRIASLTKVFTALKLWMLKERGAISWQVSFINDFVRWFPTYMN